MDKDERRDRVFSKGIGFAQTQLMKQSSIFEVHNAETNVRERNTGGPAIPTGKERALSKRMSFYNFLPKRLSESAAGGRDTLDGDVDQPAKKTSGDKSSSLKRSQKKSGGEEGGRGSEGGGGGGGSGSAPSPKRDTLFVDDGVDEIKRGYTTRANEIDYDESEHEGSEDNAEKFKRMSHKMSVIGTIYKTLLCVTIVWCYAHAMLYLAVGCMLFDKSGQILSDFFFMTYTGAISPFTPVWNDIGDNPFNSYFLYFSIYCFTMVFLHLVEVVLCICVTCLPLGRSQDTRMLLIVISAALSFFNYLTALFRSWYITVLFTNNIELLRSSIDIHYTIVSKKQFTNAFNMIMLLGECCGVDGPNDFSPVNVSTRPDMNPYKTGSYYMDFEDLPKWPDTRKDILFNVPAACCDPNLYENLQMLEECVFGSKLFPYRTKGCLNVYISIFKRTIEPIKLISDLLTAAILSSLAAVTGEKLYTKMKGRRAQTEADASADHDDEADEVEQTSGGQTEMEATQNEDKKNSKNSQNSQKSQKNSHASTVASVAQ